MSEWHRIRLGDVLSVKHGYAFPGDGFSDDSSLPTVVTPGNFAIGGGFKPSKTKTFDGPYPKEYLLTAGDLIITMTDLSKEGATLGLPAVVPSTGEFLHNQRIGLIEVHDHARIDPRFLNYYLRTAEYRSHILGTASGSTVRHTSPGRICDFVATVPTVPEQRRISEVLGALDDKVAANNQIVDAVDDYLSCEFARLCAGAAYSRLQDIAAVSTDVTRPTISGNLRYLDISAVSTGSYSFPAVTKWKQAPGRARRVVKAGDTVWSTVRPNRRSNALIMDDDPLLVGSTGLAVLTPKKGRIACTYESARRDEFVQYLESVAEGSAYPAVRADRFNEAPVPALRDDQWDHFESIALPLRRRSHAATAENRSLTAARDELLPLLMSGTIRVRETEKVVEGVV